MIDNIENSITSKLKKKKENTILNVPANILLFVIHYPNHQKIKYTVLGYKDILFFQSYKTVLIIFYIVFFLICLISAWILFFKNFDKNKARKINRHSSQSKSPKFTVTSIHQIPPPSSENSKNITYPPKQKVLLPKIRSFEQIVTSNALSLSPFFTFLSQTFSMIIAIKNREKLIEQLIRTFCDFSHSQIYKCYAHQKNNHYFYQSILFITTRSSPDQIKKEIESENTLAPLLLSNGKCLLNNYHLTIEADQYYRHFLPLLPPSLIDKGTSPPPLSFGDHLSDANGS